MNSKHDFTISNGTPLNKGGVCSPCHTPHFAPDVPGTWARDLSAERNYFNQISSPNYVPGTTLLCYDCHDDNATTASAAVDADPLKGTPPGGSWNSLSEPQDIAFGYSYNPAAPFNIVPDDTLAQGGTKAGYYELVNGDVPGGLTPMPAVTPPAAPTGGHYWKQDPLGTPDYASGDKIPCSLCHDPHKARTGSNEAFFLTSTSFAGYSPVTLGDGLKASNKDDTTNQNRSRNGTGAITSTGNGNGREMCAVCHGFSNTGSPKSIAGRTLPRPPATISQHRGDNSTACTKCHPHNKVQTSCSDCHGFPPLRTYAQAGNNYFDRINYPDVENYSGGAGAHQRHMDALGTAIFKCEICHGPDPGSAAWHNLGGGVISDGTKVNIIGLDTFWSPPAGYPGPIAPDYNSGAGVNGPDPGDSAYVFSRMGGGQRRCTGVACHGNPLAVEIPQLNWDDDMIDGDVPEPAKTGEIQICKWCHDATPAMIFVGADPFGTDKNSLSNYSFAPNVMGTGGSRASAANYGAEVNGHGLATGTRYDRDAVAEAVPGGANGAGKECTVCHDARYETNPTPPPVNRPVKTHFDAGSGSAEKRLWSGATNQVNGVTISATAGAAPNELCIACHQNAGADAGTRVSHHGNATGGGYVPLETPNFTRVCRQCHNVHGANWNGAGRNLYMVGKWLDSTASGTRGGADAGEESRVDTNATDATVNISAADNAVVFTSRTGADSFDEADIVGTQDTDDICATCHNTVTTRGGDHSGTPSTFDLRGQDCMQCHDHDYDDVPSTADGFMPSGCEGCHNGNPSYPLAPNVMTYWDGSWWDTNRGGSATRQQGGHGDPDNLAARQCRDCHNIALPSPNTHNDGTYNSIWGNSTGTRNQNTAHLNASFIGGTTPAYSVQTTLDNACWGCHQTIGGIVDMRHERDGVPAPGVVLFGTHLSRSNGDTLPLPVPNDYLWPGPYPVDQDISTNASGAVYYAPCISCHDPHGTGAPAKTPSTNASNYMLRDNWTTPSTLCKVCHP